MKVMTIFIVLLAAAGAAASQAPASNDALVPPALRVRPVEAPTAGAALREQALAKLEAQFRKADADGDGSLSVEEAKNFGFVSSHFDAIDVGRRGAVTFDDLRAYLARTHAERR